MSDVEYDYTKGPIAIDRLTQEIQQSSIVTALDYITVLGTDQLSIFFKASLSDPDKTTLDGIVAAHSGVPLPQNQSQPVNVTADVSQPKDTDGSFIQRPKAAQTGFTYQAHAVELTTANLTGISEVDQNNNGFGYLTGKYYKDESGTQCSSQLDASLTCIKSVYDWEPTYTYEIAGGRLRYGGGAQLISDLKLWVIGVPDIPFSYGGSKLMVSGLNLKYLNLLEDFVIDGRVTKRLAYDATYHTNKLRFIFRHTAGAQVTIQIIVEHFKT